MLGRKKDKRKPTSSIDTLIGSNTRVNGDMEFSGGLHIDGYIKGNIQAELESNSVLRISEKGVVEGSVSVPQVILDGTVKGDVSARERVELGANARVIGNVFYNLIEMAIGAEINGKLIHEPAGQPAVVNPTPVAVKDEELVRVPGSKKSA
ncbi:MAG: polymer-forming cytoskeletal protein [Gammaproteobacteria bacterium]|nr:polymer-forming cytoskeletal protein [Gammaproteobacteria bacterium]